MRFHPSLLRQDLYALLGVSEAAGHDEIRRAWRRLACSSHPDRNPREAEHAARKMVRINVAASILLNPAWRAEYDRQRSAGPSARRRAHGPGSARIFPTEAELSEWASAGAWSTRACLDPPQRTELAALRGWAARGADALGLWLGSKPPRQHATFLVAAACLLVVVVGCSRPSSLPPPFGPTPPAPTSLRASFR